MNFLKRLFRKKKPIIYTPTEAARHPYKEQDPHPLDNPIYDRWKSDDPGSDQNFNSPDFGGNRSDPDLDCGDRPTHFNGGDFGGGGASGDYSEGSGSSDSSLSTD